MFWGIFMDGRHHVLIAEVDLNLESLESFQKSFFLWLSLQHAVQ